MPAPGHQHDDSGRRGAPAGNPGHGPQGGHGHGRPPGQQGAKPATPLTQALNAAVVVPPPNQDAELANATKGLIEALPKDFTVDDPDRKLPAWSLAEYQFLTGDAPATVNPSLWRNAKLNMNVGLYRVVENHVYQVRGVDLSNISFLENPGNKKEVVVLDPLVSAETAAAALELYRKHRGADRRVVAVIYSHSHVDHYGGARGLFGPSGPEADVRFIAPSGFLEHAVSENVYAGTAMARRALFMYGLTIPKSATGQVDAGLGKTTSTGTVGLIAPTETVGTDPGDLIKPGQLTKVGPVNLVFQLTPGTEAPSEMNFYLPDCQSLCMAENATPTLHNLYSLRGAQVRDAKAWSDYLNETIGLYGTSATSLFASHFWPRWKQNGNEIVDFLTHQADLYRYLHDQTLRVTNSGRTLLEAAEDLDALLPPSLADQWYNHGYYGTTNHDIKAVYQRYIGWFDGNPAHLHGLPPAEVGARYVKAMKGRTQVMLAAQEAYDNATSPDDYRWAAELLSHLVFSEPSYMPARELEADILEQLGYQAESGPWRNFYLAGAEELRYRPVEDAPEYINEIPADVITAMPVDMVCDYLGIRLNGPQVKDQPMTMGFKILDGLKNDPPDITVQLRNSVLVYTPSAPATATARYKITRTGFNDLVTDAMTPEALERNGMLWVLEGSINTLDTFVGLLVKFNEDFGITTP
ncbi:alkyl/aryl-sulfatase [Yinghuangia seranimata]|uniref:alkyl/aryl-sulfatase n=1 Tax=Yinghuangia seranimata TaxID=408067 RepID=UPI00248AA30D|nr:alkyl sulfatase dimerization domain-containing protein [Yinghuangia seranimata]MDI2126197.1 alkyl sulfatase dimerization domain-containing protein [Yinghuangia seranimata]